MDCIFHVEWALQLKLKEIQDNQNDQRGFDLLSEIKGFDLLSEIKGSFLGDLLTSYFLIVLMKYLG